ncbi:hypothetical protein MACH17_18080 [Phaeobacter inhibens]|uniref:hypothetical protein n=1 Tax=Phaeobacter inhibens TaxID=221822 RepID=UPI0027600AC8|nr:hypothetical protein [Phaeobacter inhibens]GLO70291.1 hypothetical protein MACH17_18080 [Phaeobacter inhibens]
MTDLIKAADALAECQDAKDLLAACKADLEKAVVGRTAQSQLMTIHRLLGYVETKMSAIHHTLTAYRQAREGADGVKVKPLVWDRSHICSWNGDYHTVPTGYTVRCAYENGWKWSTPLGAFGYCSSPEVAKAAAQADYERRIKAALED